MSVCGRLKIDITKKSDSPNNIAGKEATDIFFGLHRYEVLQRPQYSRLAIGVVQGEKQRIVPRAIGALSDVPYAEPTWLTKGYYSPYYKEVQQPSYQISLCS